MAQGMFSFARIVKFTNSNLFFEPKSSKWQFKLTYLLQFIFVIN